MKLKFLLLALMFCGALTITLSAVDFAGNEDEKTLASKLIDAMSDEEALAQTFMFGWYEGVEAPLPLIEEWIRRRRIGGVKVFGRNTTDITRLARTIGNFQRLALGHAAHIPLFVATDQEGGLVQHVRDETSRTPGAMAIGAAGFPEDAYRAGFYIGRELSLLGINMNFAPTVDLFTNHDSILIGPRSFGDDPVKTGILAAAFARGQLSAGIIPTAKHFPGHGDTALDSHGVLPLINADFDTLWERELIPYRMLIKERIPAVMSGHIAFPNTKAKKTPASLSPWFIGEVLREKLGFDGLVITDDLWMNGATMSAGSLSDAAKQALLAGNDIIMISETPMLDAPLWTNLTRSMREDGEFKKQVRRAAQNVVRAKLRHLRGNHAVPVIPDTARLRSGIPDRDGATFFQDLAVRSATTVMSKEGAFPLPAARAGRVFLPGQNLDFFKAGRFAYPGARSYWYEAPASGELIATARDSDTIIFYLKSSEGLEVLRALQPLGKRIIVLSVLSPVHLKQLSWVDGAVAVYSDSYESLVAAFAAITGTVTPTGTIPFKF
ncbi:MAG: glycoside hydrolase family 3 protein [Spirochaetaceae bacterium]|jgi:beta-N-acetylhexosaminidase|nr:glycoside hydrolase family 3 protein [Spirochaetaceae bacterium]